MSKPQTCYFGIFFRSLSHTDLSQRPEGIPNVGVKKPDKASFRSVERPSPASWNPYEWIHIYRCPMPEGQRLMWVDHKDPEDCEVRVFGDLLPDIRNTYSLSSTGSKTSSAERVNPDPVQRIGSLDDLHEALHTDINHSFNSHVDNNENSHNGNTRMDNDNSYNTHTSINDHSFHNPDNSVADINAHNHNSHNTNRDQSLNAVYNGDVFCDKSSCQWKGVVAGGSVAASSYYAGVASSGIQSSQLAFPSNTGLGNYHQHTDTIPSLILILLIHLVVYTRRVVPGTG